jgi:hypothetical protein
MEDRGAQLRPGVRVWAHFDFAHRFELHCVVVYYYDLLVLVKTLR